MRGKKFALGFLSIMLLLGFTTVENMAHGWMAPQEAASLKNPSPSDAESGQRGKQVYFDNCAACHGDDLEGKKAEEVGLEMDTPNLKERLKTHTDGDFFWKINAGRGDMPSFKDDLPDQDKWYIINYIRQESR